MATIIFPSRTSISLGVPPLTTVWSWFLSLRAGSLPPDRAPSPRIMASGDAGCRVGVRRRDRGRELHQGAADKAVSTKENATRRLRAGAMPRRRPA
jgi:hypothetical protein